jgi:hypothetical protein
MTPAVKPEVSKERRIPGHDDRRDLVGVAERLKKRSHSVPRKITGASPCRSRDKLQPTDGKAIASLLIESDCRNAAGVPFARFQAMLIQEMQLVH